MLRWGAHSQVSPHLQCFECILLKVVEVPVTVGMHTSHNILDESKCCISYNLERVKKMIPWSRFCTERRSVKRHPCISPVVIVRVLDLAFPSLIFSLLPIRNLQIPWHVEAGIVSWEILYWSSSWIKAVNTELKSTTWQDAFIYPWACIYWSV